CGAQSPTDGQQGRCGYGPRMPFLVVSPWAKRNFVDHTLTDQSSIIRFIEDNFGLDQLGGGSSDAYAGSVMNMFDFSGRGDDGQGGNGRGQLILDEHTGQPTDNQGQDD